MQKQIKKYVAMILAVAIVLGMVPAETLEVSAATIKKGYEILMQPTKVYDWSYGGLANHTIRVTNSKGYEGIIDVNGKILIPCKWDVASQVNGGKYIAVRKGTKWGLYTCKGKLIFACKYNEIDVVNDNCVVLKKNNTYEIFTISGKFVAKLGEFDSVYGNGNYIIAEKQVNEVIMKVTFSRNGKMLRKEFDSYRGEIVYIASQGKVFYKKYETNLLYIYDHSLNLIKSESNVIALMKCGIYIKENSNYSYIYGANGKKIADTKNGIYYRFSWSSDWDVVVGWTYDETGPRVINAKGKVITSFSNEVYHVCPFVKGTLKVSYDDGCVLTDYSGKIIKSLKKYINIEKLNERIFWVTDSNNDRWLLNASGKAIKSVGKDNDSFNVWWSTSENCFVKNNRTDMGYVIDANDQCVFAYQGLVGRMADGNWLVESKTGISYVYNAKYEKIATLGKISEIERMDDGNWLIQSKTGIWYIYNAKYTKIATIGKYEWAVYGNNAVTAVNSDKNLKIIKFGMFTSSGKVIVPAKKWKDRCIDHSGQTVSILDYKNNVTVYDFKGNKLCIIPNVKEILRYREGYLIYRATNNKWGVIKVTKVGHTHKTKAYIKKKASATANGYIEYICSICGAVTKETTIYTVSKITAANKTYKGKTISTTLSIKDKAGKIISKSHYTISGTTKAKKVGTYKVKIKFKGSKYSGSKTITWKINPVKTKITKVTAGKKQFTVKWSKKKTEVTGYKIQYSTDKNFKKGVKTVTVKKDTITSKTIIKLTSKKKYYVRICTYKGNCASGWSVAKAITIK